MKFTEAQLETAIIGLLKEQGYPHVLGASITRSTSDVLIKDDLRAFLAKHYAAEGITPNEINGIIRLLELLPASDLYDSNKTFCKWLSDGFLLKREDAKKKDIYIQLIDYSDLAQMRHPSPHPDPLPEGEGVKEVSAEYRALIKPPLPLGEGWGEGSDGTNNIYKIVNQLEIEGYVADGSEKRIPDGILYINGLPLVVFEFKSAIREEATIHEAFVQLTTRYRRAIPQLFVFNALCIISDGVNNKMGNLFAPYDFFYGWRKISGEETAEKNGIDSLHTLLQGLFDKRRLREVIRHFIFFPDKTHREDKIACRYPQYYAATKLYENIKLHQKKPDGSGGDGKGGTYFGATGCGKSYTMQFLARLLMKSVDFESPTIVIITDRTDLDDQLSKQFTNAKTYIGDQIVESVESRTDLRAKLQGRKSGGVFLTTIHKFTEDAELLTDRCNVICISDEAHRSQINLDQKIKIIEDGPNKGVRKTYGFAKYLHDSLPNATYVGFTGTPIDATMDVFGGVLDSYTMAESVNDEITVRIVYEGRAAKVILENQKLKEIEDYYNQCADDGTSEYQIEDSKKAMANMSEILGDPERLQTLAADFVHHYESRIDEGSTVAGKAMFVCSSRQIAYQFYQYVKAIRPQWFEILECAQGEELTDAERKKLKPSARINMVMTRGKDDAKELWDLLGSKDYRSELDRQFKEEKSNFKIAIVVDMWLTGFDVPFLDTMYIDKPLARHNLIQTISRVNRKFESKSKGLVVDYVGIKKQMNLALAKYSKKDETNFEDIALSVVEVKNHLDLLQRMFYKFDAKPYFSGNPLQQLSCLNLAAEYAMSTEKTEKRFMDLAKRMKAAYDVCCGSESINQSERDHIHFYLAIRSIIYKLTKGEAPDTAQMNAKVRDMIAEALKSDGVEEIFKLGDSDQSAIDIFNDDYLAKIEKIKLPNTKIKLLQKLLAQAIGELKKTNKMQGINFSQKFQALVDKYNERKEDDVLVSSVLDDLAEEITGRFFDDFVDLYHDLRAEFSAFEGMGIDFEEKAFYDILKSLTVKYDFTYPDDKLVELAKAVKIIVDDKARFTDWSKREDIKASLKVDLILLLHKYGYPPVANDDAYKDIIEQAENFKKNRVA
ncbi:MAG TPA: HsdR family type I site-specific deoxyribonuclease [Cellvibrio sp.]|nr:HsdR family type I site-specific deoxyribonuclease [Cellvibrio sp.]